MGMMNAADMTVITGMKIGIVKFVEGRVVEEGVQCDKAYTFRCRNGSSTIDHVCIQGEELGRVREHKVVSGIRDFISTSHNAVSMKMKWKKQEKKKERRWNKRRKNSEDRKRQLNKITDMRV